MGDVGWGESLVVSQLNSKGLGGVITGKGHQEVNSLELEPLQQRMRHIEVVQGRGGGGGGGGVYKKGNSPTWGR